MGKETINVAIDGPSGAGKSTMARLLAQQLQFVYVDTGAMYRSIGLFAQRAGLKEENIGRLEGMLCGISIDIRYEGGFQHIFLNGEDVSELIRTEEISRYASLVSALPPVRQFLLGLQRRLAEENDVVMDGRDIGTVILPQAQVKIFLTATAEERAHRRHRELLEKGENISYEQVYQDLLQRDEKDTTRAAAPLRPAEDAVLFNSTEYNLEETLRELKKIIREKTGGRSGVRQPHRPGGCSGAVSGPVSEWEPAGHHRQGRAVPQSHRPVVLYLYGRISRGSGQG